MNPDELLRKVPKELLRKEIEELGASRELDVHALQDGVYGVVIKDFPVPEGYQLDGRDASAPRVTDVLLRLSEGYPHAAPDMFWVSPALTLATGARPAAADVFETYYGRSWQRFSWHLHPQQWRPLQDTLAGTYVPFVEHRLRQVR